MGKSTFLSYRNTLAIGNANAVLLKRTTLLKCLCICEPYLDFHRHAGCFLDKESNVS